MSVYIYGMSVHACACVCVCVYVCACVYVCVCVSSLSDSMTIIEILPKEHDAIERYPLAGATSLHARCLLARPPCCEAFAVKR